MAKYDHGIATDDEFVRSEILKLERSDKCFQVLLAFFAPAPRMRPGNLG
jgi:hypothetical protein